MTQYIKKEDILWIVNNYRFSIPVDIWLYHEVNELPTHNPYQEVIDLIDKLPKEIENNEMEQKWWVDMDYIQWCNYALRELKEKIIQLQ